MSWYLAALRKYADFSGRARRREYWLFTLFNILIIFVLLLVEGSLHGDGGIGILSGLYVIAMILPSIAVTVRRLHDTGRSGFWILLNFLPLVGPLILLVFTFLDSEEGSNQFGPNPKATSIPPRGRPIPSMG